MEKRAQSFDVCIICALYEEAQAVINEFSERCGTHFTQGFSSMDRYAYQYTTIQNKQGELLTILVTWLSGSGPTQTGLDLKPFLHEFRPRFAAMAGICAGDKRKVKLGDLVVAQYAYHYEEGKIIREPEGPSRHLPETKTADPTSQVIQYAHGFDIWKDLVGEIKPLKRSRQRKENRKPRCVIAPMASGMAVRGDDPFLWLQEKYNRNTLALDMEAATFYRALRAVSHIHGLVVKGVCDYGDMSKNDAYHDYAARTSAAYLLSFIQEYVTEQTMPRRDALPPSSRAGPLEVWNVPHLRNLHFTGREEQLDQLEQHFSTVNQGDSGNTRRVMLTQTQAIKGLGGIGKTQIAIEYAYRSRDRRRYTHTLWVNAASEETIIASFVALAELLSVIAMKNETDQRKTIEAVKRWLEQCEQRWLLIFDNADDLPIMRQYLPYSGKGDILFTTRAHAVGSLAASIEVENMSLMEGTQLLFHRAYGLDMEHAPDDKVNEAINIVIALDRFPLALDQASAYIEETGCSFAGYLQDYQNHRKELLARRGEQFGDYPASVATTWSLSFQKVQQAHPAAAELLCLCAFLAPDSIPEELIKDGATHWPSHLQQAASDTFLFNLMLEGLLKFSLVQRFVEKHILSIHRLVQAVQIDSIELDVQREWAERVVLAVNKVFPRHQGDMQAEKLASRCLDQVQRCYDLLLQYKLSLLEGADLLTRASHKMGPIDLNIRILECALEIREQHFEADHPAIAETLYYLAKSYFDVKRPSSSGKYGKAESLFMRALEIRERQLGTEHIDTVETRLSLAQLYQYRDRYSEAEQLYLSSLKILELAWGHESPKLGNVLNQIANFYALYEKHNEAKVFIQRYDHIQELRIQSKSRTKTVASGELSRDVWEPNALHLKNRLE